VDQLTHQGYDLQLGVNVLGHFYLTKLLLPPLLAAAKDSADGKARVITTSSSAHLFAKTLKFDAFKDGSVRRKMGTDQLYMQSKLGNVVLAAELARRYGNEGIVSAALNPGNIKSELGRTVTGMQRLFLKCISYDTPYGALTQLYAGTSPEGAGFNGKYLIPWARLGSASKSSQDPQEGKEFWAWLEEQVKDM